MYLRWYEEWAGDGWNVNKYKHSLKFEIFVHDSMIIYRVPGTTGVLVQSTRTKLKLPGSLYF